MANTREQILRNFLNVTYPNVNSVLIYYKTAIVEFLWKIPLVQFTNDFCCIYIMSCSWYNGYYRRKWTRLPEFKSWMKLLAFCIELISLRKVWMQLFFLLLWVNSSADWALWFWYGNQSRRKLYVLKTRYVSSTPTTKPGYGIWFFCFVFCFLWFLIHTYSERHCLHLIKRSHPKKGMNPVVPPPAIG